MRLIDLRIIRLPGLHPAFSVKCAPGINLITGPNGAGKSSLARALLNLLWPDLAPPPEGCPWETAATFAWNNQEWRAETSDGRQVRWWCDGQPADRPDLPSAGVAAAYRLGMLDLNVPRPGQDDRDLAGRIRRQMDGGFDLGFTGEELFPAAPRAGLDQLRKLRGAREEVRRLQGEHQQLDRQRRLLGQLEKQTENARAARHRQEVWSTLLQRHDRETALARARQELGAFPPGAARVQPADTDQLAAWRRDQQKARLQMNRAQEDLDAGTRLCRKLALPREKFDPDLLDELLAQLTELERELGALHPGPAALGLDQDPANQTDSPDTPDQPVTAETYRRVQELVARHEALSARLELLQRQAVAAAAATRDTPPRWAAVLSWLLAAGWLGAGMTRWLMGIQDTLTFICLVLGSPTLAGAVALSLVARAGARKRHRQEQEAEEQLLRHERETVAAQLAELGRQHGLDLRNPSLLHDLKSLDLRQEAQQRARQQQAAAADLEQRRRSLLERINRQLVNAGEEPADDGAQARARRKVLSRRLEELATLEAQNRDLGHALQGARAELERLEEKIGEMFQRLGLDSATDPDARVAELAAMHPRHEAAAAAVTNLSADIRALDDLLEKSAAQVDMDAARALSPADLRENVDRDSEAARLESELSDRLAAVRQAIKQAMAGDTLETAGARADQLLTELLDRRQESRRTAVGRLLLSRVEQLSESTSRPPVLARADALLQQFTGNRYSLLTASSPGGAVDFRARDLISGSVLEPVQLSDGTRAQLLLAVRLGFILTMESSCRPPLVLDDVLSASDPERFMAIADALEHLALDQDRQVLFLTPRPVDADAWLARPTLSAQGVQGVQGAQAGGPPERPHLIDLARVRGLAGAAPADQLEPSPVAPVPVPGDSSAVEYGALLNIPRLEAWQPHTAAHLFYLLRDRLDLLHRLLTLGCTHVGPWLAGRDQLLESELVSSAEAELLNSRVALWRETLEAWRVGRCRPVTMNDLDSSGAVSATMRERVQPVLDEVRGDGRALLEALRQSRVRGFQTAKINQLQEHLELVQLLPAGDPLSEDQLVLRVLGNCLSTISLDRNRARELALQLARALDLGI